MMASMDTKVVNGDRRMRRGDHAKWLTPALLVALALAVPTAASAKTSHGFRDAQAPREAARVLMGDPNVTSASCHWKQRGHTIACSAEADALRFTYVVWSTGTGRPRYRGCYAGACKTARAKHLFGHPY